MSAGKLVLLLAGLAMAAAPASAGDTGIRVSTWDVGCEHTMTTNHFELAPGDAVEIQLDFASCTPDKLGTLLVFGYRTSRNSSELLTQQDNVRFTVVDPATGVELTSDSGSLLSQLGAPGQRVVFAQNMNRKKNLTLRLRAQSGI